MGPPAARPPPGAGIFTGLHSYPGDLVDNLTRNGGFAFLEDLQDTNKLWTLRDVRMPRIAPKGEAQREFAACSLLVLKLADQYPAQSLPQYIIRVVFHFLPALLMPCARKGRPSHIIKNAKKFQKRSVGIPVAAGCQRRYAVQATPHHKTRLYPSRSSLHTRPCFLRYILCQTRCILQGKSSHDV